METVSRMEPTGNLRHDLLRSLDEPNLIQAREDALVAMRQQMMRLHAALAPSAKMGGQGLAERVEQLALHADTIVVVDQRLSELHPEPIRGACCEKAERAACVCKFATVCPQHGERHSGSHE